MGAAWQFMGMELGMAVVDDFECELHMDALLKTCFNFTQANVGFKGGGGCYSERVGEASKGEMGRVRMAIDMAQGYSNPKIERERAEAKERAKHVGYVDPII